MVKTKWKLLKTILRTDESSFLFWKELARKNEVKLEENTAEYSVKVYVRTEKYNNYN